ncbi:isoleucine--tRNA ligase [Candidatus Woesearchaeota archaeon]|nr:isoleucine--tRNA ligase [Candidatus Woesearchaeota archaeon]
MSCKENEEKIVRFWKEKNIFNKSVEQRPTNKTFIFYDGPPFATGLPHYGHIQGLTCKDLFPRFWTMRGYRSERRWGWDCHGLPIENLAEKELGIKEKKEIETMGVGKFNEFCRSKVLFFAEEWKKTVDRIGIWMEFNNSYKTMDNSYMETVWYIFKTLWQKGSIYEGKKVLLFCPHCETPLANAEISMDNSYKTVTEKSATAKFKLKKEPDTYLLAWTTTPWTLIGNVAIAVNEQFTYVKIKQGKENLIVAKDRLQEIRGNYKVISECKGKALLHKEYEPLYPIPSEKKGHYVINGGDEVSAEEGTGLVHMAAYGEFDYQMIKKYDLPFIQHVGKHGKLIAGPQSWLNVWFKKADKHVLEDLEQRNLLYKAEDYTHPYPFCYRCETPLFYNAVDSWFIDIQKIKSKLLDKNEEINWHPSHLKQGRFKNILETAPDWSISRNRYWATTIPVWKCTNEKCKELTVIGSIKELQEQAIETISNHVDLHKHILDNIHLKCRKCKGTMNRVPEVIDCWFESGSMPYAAKHYPFENKEWFANNFPCDFVSEYIGQVRAWFYYMHVMGVLLFEHAPFRNIKVSGNVLAADGSKMSKSKKNYPDPSYVLDKYGADALRFYLMSSSLMKAEDLNFKEENLLEVYRKIMIILSNIKNFYELFAKDNKVVTDASSTHLLDRWIISKLHFLIRATTNALEKYDPLTACTEISSFINELSTWYIRRSRDRFKEENSKEREKAIHTLAYVLVNFSKVIAPIMPFIAEEIYQMLRNKNKTLPESVHLDFWPRPDQQLINEELHQTMDITRDIVRKALDQREKSKIPIRQALSVLTIRGVTLEQGYQDLIGDEVNVKKIIFKEDDVLSVDLNTELTPELIKEGISRTLIRLINSYRKELGLTIEDRIILYVMVKDSTINQSIEKFQPEIAEGVQADQVEFAIPSKVKKKEVMVNDVLVQIALEVI